MLLLIELFIAFIYLISYFKCDDEKNNIWSKISNLMGNLVWICILLLFISLFFSRTTIGEILFGISIFYLLGICIAGIVLILYGILKLFGFVGAGIYKVAENSDKIVKAGRTAKNNITNALNKKEYEINVIEKEELKIETKIDEENSTIEKNIEYRKDRLVIIEEKTYNFFKRIFNNK